MTFLAYVLLLDLERETQHLTLDMLLNCKLLNSPRVVDGNFKTWGNSALTKDGTKALCLLEVTNPVFAPYCHYVMSEKLGIISN